MSWREEIHSTGKFRGFTFNVARHNAAGGRRLDVALPPFADEPDFQDLGAQVQTMRVDAFLLGADYVTRRRGFIELLNEPGEGLLIHPWLGQHRVRVARWSVAETQDEGGIARFGIEFIRAGPPQKVRRHVPGRSARAAQAAQAADVVEAVAVAAFQSDFQVDGVAGFVVEAAAEDVAGFGARMVDAIRKMQGDTSAILRRVRDVVDGAIERVLDPQGLAFELRDGIRTVSEGIVAREEALRVLLALSRSPAQVDRGGSGQARIAEDNARLTNGLLAGVALGEAVRRAVAEDWPSRQDAESVKGRLVEAIEAHGETVPPRIWQELHAMEAALTAILPGPRGELPDTRRVQLEETEPALVVAYRMDGDIEGAADFVSRNKVAHPLFVPPLVELEVLARGTD